MNIELLMNRMVSVPRAIHALVADLPDADIRWKPDDGAWSILEIVTHLADEEEEDFRTRISLLLQDPTQDWPPIDPAEWATEREYNEGSLAAALNRFEAQRAISMEWLRSLQSPVWTVAKQHPKIGAMHAGDIMAAWAAHDALHVRQIAKRLFELAKRDAGEFQIGYAGSW